MPIEITEVFHARTRAAWRGWLEKHHRVKTEVWLRRFNKASGKRSISYDDMVEECLCFGWIDGVLKKLDDESNAQRITPRRAKGTFLSELNRQRVWKLQRLGLMTPAGIAPIADQIGSPDDPFEIPGWILERLRADREVWVRFEAFPRYYKRLKVGWIADIRGDSRRAEAEKRLAYLIQMTRAGRMYGAMPEVEAPSPGTRKK